MGQNLRTKQSKNKHSFWNDKQAAIGTIDKKIPVKKAFNTEQFYTVNTDVPFLIGLDFLDTYKMYVNNASNRLVCK